MSSESRVVNFHGRCAIDRFDPWGQRPWFSQIWIVAGVVLIFSFCGFVEVVAEVLPIRAGGEMEILRYSCKQPSLQVHTLRCER